MTDEEPTPPLSPGELLAAFYDRRAPAALAYCARVCEPESISDAVEEAFGAVFARPATDEEELELRLREALAAAVRKHARPDAPLDEAERAYEALSGDDAPALGRSALGQMIEAPATAAAADTAILAEASAPATPAKRRLSPRVRRRLVVVMAVLGTLLLAEAVVTAVWKEPFTGYLAARAQDDLDKQLDKLNHEQSSLDADDQRSLAEIDDADARERKRMSLLAARLDESVDEGEALGRVQIPKIDVDFVFVQGIEGASLRKGPGHYHPATALPGEGGIVGIAGHRTTYEAPFRKVDELKAGDRIALRMPYGLFTYEVTGHRIVPADYKEAFTGSGEQLVLSACHPLYSSSERILVDAKLVGSSPLGAAIESAPPELPGVPTEELARQRVKDRLERLGDRQLGPGMTGPDVRELQRLLGMPVSGVFDANTSAAVLAFQREHGLPQVGRVGSQTKRALARQTHLPSRPPTPADVPRQEPPEDGSDQQPSDDPSLQQPTGTTTTPRPSPRPSPEPKPERRRHPQPVPPPRSEPPSASGPGTGR